MKIFRSEPITMLARSYGYFPAAFRWRGRRFDVTTVEKCWTMPGPGAQRLFRVRCDGGAFLLEQGIAGDAWRVKRWPLAYVVLQRPKTKAARFPLPRRQRRPRRASSPVQAGQPQRPAADRRTGWTAATQRL